MIDALTDSETGVVKSLSEIVQSGHRVVHGGEKFASSVVINDEVLAGIEACSDLAPLHQSCQPDRYPRLPEADARYTDGSCI